MNKLLLITLLLFFSELILAHGGEDPLKELAKSRNRLSTSQQVFETLKNQTDRYDNLLKQVKYLQTSIFILRNMMVKDYPHVNENMSKYKLDYMTEVDESLKSFRDTLEQMKETINE